MPISVLHHTPSSYGLDHPWCYGPRPLPWYLGLYPPQVPDSEEVEIKKGMIFDTLEHLKYFLKDYAVRFHRPYYVSHSDKNKRYTVLYKNGCQ